MHNECNIVQQFNLIDIATQYVRINFLVSMWGDCEEVQQTRNMEVSEAFMAAAVTNKTFYRTDYTVHILDKYLKCCTLNKTSTLNDPLDCMVVH